MRYMGGKHRQGPKIAEFVVRVIGDRGHYYEPFCGAMGSACAVIEYGLPRVSHPVQVALSDSNVYVVRMWADAVGGWEPPMIASEDTYQRLKKERPVDDPLTAFYGYGLSFGGKWFGGYARGAADDQIFLKGARKSVLRKATVLRSVGATVRAADYSQITPTGAVIYLDPPYAGRTKAHGVAFNHAAFYDYARGLLKDNVVLLTEFMAPPDFVRVHSWGNTVVRHHAGLPPDGTDEAIFMHESQAHLAGVV